MVGLIVGPLAYLWAGGSYQTTLRPLRTAVYKVVYAGTAAHKGSTAPLRTVTVR